MADFCGAAISLRAFPQIVPPGEYSCSSAEQLQPGTGKNGQKDLQCAGNDEIAEDEQNKGACNREHQKSNGPGKQVRGKNI